MSAKIFSTVDVEIPILSNSGLKLKPVTLEDSTAYYHFIKKNQEYLMEWIDSINYSFTEEHAKKEISKVLLQKGRGTEMKYLLWKFSDVIGFLKFRINPEVDAGFATFSYVLGRSNTSQELFLSTCRKSIGLFFRSGPIDCLSVEVTAGNTNASVIPKKLGLKYIGKSIASQELHGKKVDKDIYIISRRGWVQRYGLEV